MYMPYWKARSYVAGREWKIDNMDVKIVVFVKQIREIWNFSISSHA